MNQRGAGALALAAVGALFLFGCAGRTPPITGKDGRPVPGSVAVLEKVLIGGVNQWISVRAENRDAPALLFLHCGPGFSEMALVRHFNQEWEKHFVVVNWDQRAAGKGYWENVPAESMRLDRYVEDTKEIVELIKKGYGKKRVFLVGHSWGTILGMLYLQRYPEDVIAYVGSGQVADPMEGEAVSYEWALGRAQATGNSKALADLQRIGRPVRGQYAMGMEGTDIERDWLARLGGEYRFPLSQAYRVILLAPEYTLRDKLAFFKGGRQPQELEDQIHTFRLCGQIVEVKVPVYFLLGRFDYAAPSRLAAAYLSSIKAPRKVLYWFEQSGHAPMFEEPEKYNRILIDTVLRENAAGGD